MKNTTLLALATAVSLAITPPAMAEIYGDDDEDMLTDASVEHQIGAGTGALIGGIAGGPPGVLVGGFIGGLFGEQARLRDRNLDLRGEVAHLKIEVASLRQRNVALADAARTPASGRQTEQHPGRAQTVSLPQAANAATLYPTITALAMTVQFRLDSERLETHFQTQLQALANEFKSVPGLKFELQGFADRLGKQQHNQHLSQRRVNAVAEVLINAGWPRERLILKSYGEQRPVTQVGDTEAYPFDRRVLIRLRAGGPSA